jgi:hypothetical protein
MRAPPAALAAALLLAACQGEDPEPRRWTCDASATVQRTCTEFGPLDDYGLGYNEWYCTGVAGGTWGLGLGCPAEGRVATCEMPPGQGDTIQHWYAGATDLAGIERQCTMYGGVWTTYP